MDEDLGESLLNAIEVERQPEVEELLGSISPELNLKLKEEEKLRQKLIFFYMNPIEKWEYKQRFPYKFIVQLIKIFIVTLQSCLFAHHRSFYIDFISNNKVAFSHLFLQDWDPSREIISYPPQSGDLAVYNIRDFYSAIDFAVVNYANLDEAVGSYYYPQKNNATVSTEFCFRHFETCDLFGFNDSYVFNSSTSVTCLKMFVNKKNASNFSSEDFLRKKNLTVQFSSLVEATLTFSIKAINLKPIGPRALPNCYLFNLSIVLDNKNHDGKIKLLMVMSIYKLNCKGTISYQSDTQWESIMHSLINSACIIFCLVSIILCSRALFRAQNLRWKTVDFLRKNYNKELSLTEKLEFVNWWYLTMIFSDIIIIVGSGLKEKIEQDDFDGDEWNICSVMLGSGTFLIWFCVLRYLGFFKTYNVVVLTLKEATPMILRFMVCSFLIYIGFTFCGWLVLGPYHSKFRTLSVTCECLFALINGDDVFDTFSTLEPTQSVLMWWFCRIYLYIFVTLFIYVILSLFLSIIVDAYETIKRYYAEGFPKNCIQQFMDGGLRRNVFSDSSSSLADDIPKCCPNNLKTLIREICCFGKVNRGKQNPD